MNADLPNRNLDRRMTDWQQLHAPPHRALSGATCCPIRRSDYTQSSSSKEMRNTWNKRVLFDPDTNRGREQNRAQSLPPGRRLRTSWLPTNQYSALCSDPNSCTMAARNPCPTLPCINYSAGSITSGTYLPVRRISNSTSGVTAVLL